MYSYGSPHMAAQKQDDQHERTFSSYVRIQVVVLKTCLGRWTIGRSGERGSGISVLPARYDDDDDMKVNMDLSLSLSLYIYIYIYIYVFIFRQHFFVNANFIKHNRHFMSTYFLLDPFEFPYYFYCILGELIYVLSIVACIPSTFCPTLGHHQGRIYYKSDVTFVLAYYYCVRASLPLKVMAFVFECDSIFSASS